MGVDILDGGASTAVDDGSLGAAASVFATSENASVAAIPSKVSGEVGSFVNGGSELEIGLSSSPPSLGMSLTVPCYAHQSKNELNTNEMFARSPASRLEPYVSSD
jgi:hypothetical protein